MALNMLVSGADCGPVNPLQGLAKRFDQDRGVQQVFLIAHETCQCGLIDTSILISFRINLCLEELDLPGRFVIYELLL